MGFEFIANISQLELAAKLLEREPLLACDLEADSMHHYKEKVCLVQISSPGASYIIDPLACQDLSILAPIFANPRICKIFHGADYDVRSLHRDFGIEIHNLFDTMIACQFLGEAEFGLAAVLRKRFGVELDKRFQQADWSRRPISGEMLDYAVKDTTLLIPLYEQLKEELGSKGRFAWVQEECELLSRVRSAERRDEPLFLRFKGASKLSPPTLAVLESLLKFRETEAERRDVPPFKVLGNEVLRVLAERKPSTLGELDGITGLSPRLLQRYGVSLLTVIKEGVATPPGQYPEFPHSPRKKRTPANEARLKLLKAWRESKSDKTGLAPGLIANNALLETLADQNPGSENSWVLENLKQWQFSAFGAELATLLAS
ncbi:HRDC domain-containing protein [Geobacter pelophilus]|uniref:HRDC domain-containing protein n=1 Tax=Geoanaerobacter pelophilus TaxID=60036 RepID=A0AAW4L1A5_9BACT|nr:HRDC domain-containing protein [Geoanaerobacter pelophilus]MBT0664849.1 HRDC domain-containing protein [Geoanaerobacter pelophilus]